MLGANEITKYSEKFLCLRFWDLEHIAFRFSCRIGDTLLDELVDC